MSTRRVLALLASVALLAVAAPGARAQGDPTLTVVVASQTPFARPNDRTVAVELLARNDGEEALDNLSLRATLWSHVTSLDTYLAALRDAPPTGTLIDTSAQPFEGTLEPGQTRRFRLDFQMKQDLVSQVQSYVYPLEYEILSGATPVASIRSAIVFIVREPLRPLALSTRVTLAAPLSIGPDGMFTSDALERDIAPSGRIGATIATLRDAAASERPPAFDIVVSPLLLLQLDRMRQGYSVRDGSEIRTVPEGAGASATAAELLADLRAIVRSEAMHVSAWPLAAPRLPSLLEHLSRDLDAQMSRGRTLVNRVLGQRAAASVVHPPGSAVTNDTIERLRGDGARVLLLDAAAAPAEPQPLGLAAPAVRRLPSTDEGGGGEPVAAVVADAGLQEHLESDAARTNPVLVAQRALGHLATIWLEQPGVERNLAVALPGSEAPAGLAPPMLRRIDAAPFLRPVAASDLVQEFPPPETPATLIELEPRTFSAAYAAAIKHSRRLIDTYRSMLVEPSPIPKQLKTRLLLIEGAQFLDREGAGRAEIAAVDDRVHGFLREIRPIAAPLVTLTSRRGQIPVQIVNDTGEPVRVDVQLLSPHLAVGEQVQRLTLSERQRQIAFGVELKTTGEFFVQVRLLAPSGRPINDTTIAVRSTAYSRIALIVTIGAAIALLALWARRFLPSRRRTAA